MDIGQLNAIFSQQALCEENIDSILSKAYPSNKLPTRSEVEPVNPKYVFIRPESQAQHRKPYKKSGKGRRKWTKYEEQQILYGKRQRIPKGRTVTACISHLQAIGEKVPNWLYAKRHHEVKNAKR